MDEMDFCNDLHQIGVILKLPLIICGTSFAQGRLAMISISIGSIWGSFVLLFRIRFPVRPLPSTVIVQEAELRSDSCNVPDILFSGYFY